MRIIITPKDVQRIFDCNADTARKKIRAVKDSLQVKAVTISQFAREFGLPEDEVKQALK